MNWSYPTAARIEYKGKTPEEQAHDLFVATTRRATCSEKKQAGENPWEPVHDWRRPHRSQLLAAWLAMMTRLVYPQVGEP